MFVRTLNDNPMAASRCESELQSRGPRHRVAASFFSLLLIAAGLTTSAVAVGAPSQKQNDQRPSVVYLLADQWRGQAVGYAGDPNVRTPHLDRLASQSVVLTTAVATAPVCSPYRASLMTGRMPTTHGVFLNDVCLSREAVSLAQAFARGGYRTGYIGKWHLDGHGRASFIPPERRQGFEFWRANECTHNYNRSIYYADTDEPLYWDGYDAEDQTEEARRYIRRHKGEPFLLVLSWGPPHNPYQTAPERFRKMFKPQDIQLRPNVPPQAEEAARKDLAGYYAHCAALDEYTGRIVDTLAECGIADNTILVFTSDHGDMLGSHDQSRKQRPWDESILVPFIARWPKGNLIERKLSAPMGTPDILPTLLGLCGLEIPDTAEGTDRSAWLAGREPDEDRAALISCVSPFGEWTRENGGREYRGVRTKRYTYVRTLDGPWMLFDNQTDPYQQRNLIGDPELATTQSRLETQLQAELSRYKDEFLPGADYIAQWGYKVNERGTVPYKP